MAVPTLEWKGGLPGELAMIDQTLLPGSLVVIKVKDIDSLRNDIRRLAVRGAPAIGLAACFGVVLGVQEFIGDRQAFDRRLSEVIDFLAQARPTAVNLFGGLERMRRTADENPDLDTPAIKQRLLDEAQAALREDQEICLELGELGQTLLPDNSGALTHCNAGALATSDHGTALSVFFAAARAGKTITVYADETRPLLQGARLTAWELKQAGIDVTLICDNAAGHVMKEGRIDAVFVGADRIAANGDTANKIGTYSVSVLAKAHCVPFYVVAPVSTIDMDTPDGASIPIEERSGDEVRRFGDTSVAPSDVKAYNPAFDVTPAENITAIVTEKGIIREPTTERIAAVVAGQGD